MRNSSLIALLLLLASCSSDGKKNTSAAPASPARQLADFLILPGERIGAVTEQSTEAQLRMTYGEEQVKIASIDIGEGEAQEGLLLFPGTPNELEILLDIAAATGHPHFVRISKDSTAWRTPQGITIGSTLQQLERANGKPFQLYGFEWDLAGLVADWDGGHFSSNFVVALTPDRPQALRPAHLGDQLFSSDDPILDSLSLRVGSIVVTF